MAKLILGEVFNLLKNRYLHVLNNISYFFTLVTGAFGDRLIDICYFLFPLIVLNPFR